MWTIYLRCRVTKVYADYWPGDIVAPTTMPPEPLAAHPVGTDADERAESALRTGVVAFLIGLFTGWAARRRS